MATIVLRHLTFQVVTFCVHLDDESERDALVHVGSGSSWQDAVRFPCPCDGEAGETTGDDTLDNLIRARAAEELVRLEAAVSALREQHAA